jgi:hypothetical protein
VYQARQLEEWMNGGLFLDGEAFANGYCYHKGGANIRQPWLARKMGRWHFSVILAGLFLILFLALFGYAVYQTGLAHP